jgi:hypothetical protein
MYLAASGITSHPPIVAVSRKGSVYVAAQLHDGWASESINSSWPGEHRAVLSVYPIPMLRSFLVIRQDAVDLVDVETRKIINTFSSVDSQPSSVQCFYSIRRTAQYGSNNLTSFSLVYTHPESGDCILQTYSPKREGEVFCISTKKSPDDQISCSWNEAIVQVCHIENPGKWNTLPVGVVIGVRKRPSPTLKLNGSGHSGQILSSSTLRRRPGLLMRDHTPSKAEDEDVWEAWMLSAKGERTTVTLNTDENGEASNGHLLVSNCGPMIRIGQRSIAVGMGNVVKVITVGNERFNIEENSDDMVKAMSGRRRRPAAVRKRSYGHDR